MNKTNLPRILHLASGDLWAGAESQLYTLVTTLHRDLEITVTVVLLNRGTLEVRLRKAGINVTVVDESALNDFQILLRLVGIFKVQRPDIIHTHRIKENILGSLAGLIAGNAKSLRTIHGAPEHPPSWQLVSKRIIWILNRITGNLIQDRIISVSDDLAVILTNDYRSNKIHVIENGIDIDFIANQAKSFTCTHPRDPNCFRIGLIGRLVPVKRVDLLIQTARHLIDYYPDLQTNFHIIGDGPLYGDLERLSRSLKTDKIVYFEGYRDNIAHALQELDILLMTSDHEGLPMALMEAMVLHIPIISHAVGGIPKLLDHGSCGALVTDHSAAGYAEKIAYLCRSAEVRTEYVARASEHIASNYSAIDNARAYLAQYKEICRHT